MSYNSVYEKCVTMFIEDIQEMVDKTQMSVETAFACRKLANEQKRRHEEELLTERQHNDEEKAAILAALDPIMQASFSNGVALKAREALERIGHQPTRRNLGIVNWQIRQLTYNTPTGNVMPAE